MEHESALEHEHMKFLGGTAVVEGTTFLERTAMELDKFRDFVYAEGALDRRTKLLIALSNCVALGCEPCMLHRLKAARDEFDCSKDEIEEAVALAIMNSAGVTQARVVAAWNKLDER
jgi:alkylhydroperoxidase/carboxymuconolactone decarboxylase family protein YurZ